MDVAIATCRVLPEPDPDAAPLARALADACVRAETVAWDDPEADWSRARLTVLRSTWNYPEDPSAFEAWVGRVECVSALWNPPAVVRWNLHKRYLVELAERGIPTVPTEVVERGSRATLAEIAARRGWDAVVVKPAVSAASFGTMRCDRNGLDAGEAHLRKFVAERDMLVQPYLRSVEGYGERALVWVDGEVTHAVRKSPRFAGEDESVSDAMAISAEEEDLARRAVEVVPERLLYARIDVAPGPDGEPVVMELELMEPSLFFDQGPRALERFVAGIRARLG